ncbi:energy-coupling factor ABC transporter permease [Nitrosophilus labii]|uniref:energy-coupling factor ABC transporter permease n=1 Tax=Nitrosophilus labii TaxID=2706014 RepID=UPI001656BBA9|nr:energy-coupling factor ABC transporter permease [Nitrosophilus labii]
MHIPDGFISPITYIPAYAASAVLWYIASKKVEIDSQNVSFLATLSALSFVFMMIAIPLPGGTSAHLSGIALLALIFGPWLSFVAASLVLVVEALIFGEGGVTTLGINILAIAFVGSFSSYYVYKVLKRRNETLAIFLAGWVGVNLSAVFIAFLLGIQPIIASIDGKPLFFPFDIKTTTLAIMVPHMLIGLVEGAVTVILYRFLKKNFKVMFDDR